MNEYTICICYYTPARDISDLQASSLRGVAPSLRGVAPRAWCL